MPTEFWWFAGEIEGTAFRDYVAEVIAPRRLDDDIRCFPSYEYLERSESGRGVLGLLIHMRRNMGDDGF